MSNILLKTAPSIKFEEEWITYFTEWSVLWDLKNCCKTTTNTIVQLQYHHRTSVIPVPRAICKYTLHEFFLGHLYWWKNNKHRLYSEFLSTQYLKTYGIVGIITKINTYHVFCLQLLLKNFIGDSSAVFL